MKKLLALSAVASIALLSSTELNAQVPRPLCQPFPQIEKLLAERFNEKPVEIGQSAFGHRLYLFANSETGTWTVVTRLPNGLGCWMDAGKRVASSPKGADRPARFIPL